MQVHFIVGMAQIRHNIPQDKIGVMADVAASPNDPIFINHHAMVDCILEKWLQQESNPQYPDIPAETEYRGHRMDDYMVPFFPLVKHSDMFKTADNFGYSCELPDDSNNPGNRPGGGGGSPSTAVTLQPLPWLLLIAIMGSIV